MYTKILCSVLIWKFVLYINLKFNSTNFLFCCGGCWPNSMLVFFLAFLLHLFVFISSFSLQTKKKHWNVSYCLFSFSYVPSKKTGLTVSTMFSLHVQFNSIFSHLPSLILLFFISDVEYGIISNGSARTYEYLTNVKTMRDIGAVQSEIHTLLL